METNGVITEKRYQDLTPAQWMFQYAALQKIKADGKKLEAKDSYGLMEILSQDIETLAMVINPKKWSEFSKVKTEIREKRRNIAFSEQPNKKTDNDNVNTLDVSDDKNISEYMEKYYDTVPDKFVIPAKVINKNRYFLPTFNKEKDVKKKRRFIQLEEETDSMQTKNIEENAIKSAPKKINKLTKKELKQKEGD